VHTGDMRSLLASSADTAAAYLEALPTRSVAPAAAALEALGARLDAPLPATGTDPHTVLDELSAASAAMHTSSGGRYFGFVTGGTLPAALAADWLVATWDQNGWSEATAPAAALFEQQAVGWLIQLLGLPSSCGGVLCSGCTAANTIALASARDAVLGDTGWDVEADGLVGSPPISVFLGEQCHSSVLKALGIVGLGRSGRGRHVTALPAAADGSLQAPTLVDVPPPTAPAIVVLQAGHVNTGSFDDLEACIAWARSGSGGGRGVWVHIDGAFGMWAAASADTSRRSLVDGVRGADSWATDLHKMLNCPYESALLAVRDGRTLHTSMSCPAPYTPPRSTEAVSTARPTAAQSVRSLMPEAQNSRRARGVVAWAAIKQLGARGIAELVDGCCERANALAVLLQEGGAELVSPVVFNQALVRFGDDRRTAAVAADVQRDGRCWLGATTVAGRVVLRLSVSSWRTTHADIESAARAILECAATTDGGV
jgi:glutamate/tyrosine decarboxylase-like PLP-dependent enzyme